MHSRLAHLLIVSLFGLPGWPALADERAAQADGPGTNKAKIDFARDIRPILAARCWSCHGEKASEGGLRLHTRKAALAGGDSGKAILPGRSGDSRLIKYVTGKNDAGLRMPPETNGEPLAAGQIALLRSWIDQGVAWPEQPLGKTPGAAAKHWSFQPIRRPRLPAVKNIAGARNAIDYLVLAELERRGIAPSPEADRPTLLRRLSLDLIGLPPTPEEVRRFGADDRPDAYERLVDRLLASPHYGERWGRHWLDLARYADSDGYEKDLPRPHAWRFRQWVIEALNADLPFDQFTIEQLAGDLLPGAAIEQKIATGFHRNTLTNREGGVDPEEDRVKQTIDRTNTTGTVWLGLTVECAQCHSHKYDPLSQREYYALLSFFNSLQEVDLPLMAKGNEALSERKADIAAKPKSAEKAAKDKPATNKANDQPLAQTLAELARPRETHLFVRGDFLQPGAKVETGTPAVLPPLASGARRPTRLDLARWLVDRRNPLTPRVTVNRIWQRYFGQGLVDTPHDFGTQGSPPSHAPLLDYLASELAGVPAPGVSAVAIRHSERSEESPAAEERPAPRETLRSAQGDRRAIWSQKALHRLIVTSATYRQSSRTRPELREIDPYNKLLARQNRLRVEAEIVRDLALAASGLLEPRIGGPSVRPPQPSGIDALGYAGSVKWGTSTGADRYQRGIYTFFQRTVPYPMLKDFDAPDGNIACTRRERSNTPISALTMQNDPVFVECCQALARRLIREEAGHGNENCDRAGRVQLAFQIVFGRRPAGNEVGTIIRLHRETLAHFRANPKEARQMVGPLPKPPGALDEELAAWSVVARTLLNADEFITRE